MVKIDKGIKMPAKNHRKYPWAEMQVGDSFLVQKGSGVTVLCRCANRRHAPKRFEARYQGGEARVWRVA